MKIRAIITGATGMVGEGVLLKCLESADVESVLVINRKPCGVTHPKLKEIIHKDFMNVEPIRSQLSNYNACYFCLGVSSVGMDKDTYYQMTYTLTMHVARVLSELNTDMTFCYVSGGGTDSTEKGRQHWARVKGKTENDLMQLPFKAVYAFRPGFIKKVKGQKNVHPFYRYINWVFPVGRLIYAPAFCKMEELARAMMQVTLRGYEKNVLEGRDIIEMGKEV
ncbi:NAD-dependent epimerase/dehydratase family protein [Chitinophaga agri]|uniref:Epimerase n=1 Tax=Chitinophaga agri TaxID=2703787 RepID=A0A6B9Z8J7_9BACT|nr:NAD-dependent epimerase/dehydratase family protein [Chitinophaga agri]QHS58572.1 epimerase [Chitinophaga agri]